MTDVVALNASDYWRVCQAFAGSSLASIGKPSGFIELPMVYEADALPKPDEVERLLGMIDD